MRRPLSEVLARLPEPVALPSRSPSSPPQGPTAFGGEGPRGPADLAHDVLALAEALAGDRGRRWLIDTEDAYRVAVSLLAASIVGARIVLPPNVQPGTLDKLGAECDRVLAETPPMPRVGLRARAPGEVLDPLAAGRAAVRQQRDTGLRGPVLDRNAALVELFTSGSSGPEKLVCKTLGHLEDEVVELEALFGADAGAGAPVFATVSPRHLYGLLFRVLWPLASRRPLARSSFLLPDELLPRVLDAGAAILVATPVHLRHLASSPRLADAASCVNIVFSSGGPLETSTALAIEKALGSAPVEIFGSTETGGVAWRRASQADPSPPWRPFPSVRLAVKQDRLEVTSPFVTAPAGSTDDVERTGTEQTCGEQTWLMGDRAELGSDGFRLLGRADRVVKIGEKSFSLPAIEASLLEHELVDAAVLGTYRGGGEARIGALVVLGVAGRERLASLGRRSLSGQLAAHLARHWDRIALPRRWRFVPALTADERGKLTAQAVEAELTTPAPPVLDPLVVEQTVIAEHRHTRLESHLLVPRDLAYLEGHYERFPLVPGVTQIHWVMAALADLLGRPARLSRMEAIKFKDVLRPGQPFTLRIDYDDDAHRASFQLADGGRTFSSGRILLGGDDRAGRAGDGESPTATPATSRRSS